MLPANPETKCPVVPITCQMAATGTRGAPPPDVLRRAIDGDRDAFSWLYREYHQVVFRFARAMLGTQESAEDVTQEVFMALIAELGRYDPARAAFTTYLYGIVRNLTRERLRRESRFLSLDGLTTMPEPVVEGSPLERLEEVELAACVRRALRRLPATDREVVVLCDLHGLSYAEAATVVGASVAAVRSRLHRARQLLRRHLARVLEGRRGRAFGAVRCVFGGTS